MSATIELEASVSSSSAGLTLTCCCDIESYTTRDELVSYRLSTPALCYTTYLEIGTTIVAV